MMVLKLKHSEVTVESGGNFEDYIRFFVMGTIGTGVNRYSMMPRNMDIPRVQID